MNRVKLDAIDRKILRDLQANGRVTNVELARRVGISAPPCLRRVRALEEAGYIRGYHADIDPEQRHYRGHQGRWCPTLSRRDLSRRRQSHNVRLPQISD